MTPEPINHSSATSFPEWQWLRAATKWADSKFRIPGTTFHFGMESIAGLIPYVGDASGLLFSSLLLTVMAKKGVGTLTLFKMLGNILLDLLAGSVPLLGDIFDIRFKANRRNIQHLEQHYASGKPHTSFWFSLFYIILTLIVASILLVWVIWKLGAWIFSAAWHHFGGS